MKSSAKKIELASVDDLFSTEEGRQDAKLEKIQEIPLSELHPFKNHPFKVKDDEAMMETADSIKQYGVLVPAIARPDPEGGYELVAGHRRHRASELAEKETMPVIVRDLDDDAATIIMVDSNLQRESLLPSERAFAYKMKLEAVKHQGARTDLTSRQVGEKSQTSIQKVADQAGESQRQVQRYPYWSWYGFDSRVEWCACFVSWCYNQAGKSEPRFAGCEWQGVPWFQSHGQWGARGYNNLAPGDAIFFDWDLDGTADHVGIVIGTDGSRVYTVEGNSGDACKIKSYDLNYQSIKGYGLMNW